MKLINYFELCLRCILLLTAIYHLYKKQYKIMWTPVLIFGLSFLPLLLHKLIALNVDSLSIMLYDIILFMALYLGTSLGLYERYKWWDRSIHFLSGAAFTGFGIAVIRLNPTTIRWLILLFGFTFSATIHVFWEILEYISDCIFHGDAQRWQKVSKSNNHVSEKAIQPAGLVDTMSDFICCICGSALSVVFWWLTL